MSIVDTGTVEVLLSWVQVRDLQLSDDPVQLDKSHSLIAGGTVGFLVYSITEDGRPVGFHTAYAKEDSWSEVTTLWEAKRLPGNRLLVRRNLRSLLPEECEILREHLQSLAYDC